jgi:hypothetical protein
MIRTGDGLRLANTARMFSRLRTVMSACAAILAAASFAVPAGGAEAASADSTRSSGSGMLVLIDRCDGFVAPGGLAPGATPPFPYSWNHNFLATWEDTATWKFRNDETGATTFQDITFHGSGTDSDGQTFDVKGKLSLSLFASPDLWADGGTVRIRRADGAVLTGTALGGGFLIFDPIFSVDRVLMVTATDCPVGS